MAASDPALSDWLDASGFSEYTEILTKELGVEEYDDFRLLRDERDINELLDDMANLKPMDDSFKQRFKSEMIRIINTPSPPRRTSTKTTSPKKTTNTTPPTSSDNPSISNSTSVPIPPSSESSPSKPKRPSSAKSKHKRLASSPVKPQKSQTKSKSNKSSKPRIERTVSADTNGSKSNSLTLTMGKSKKSKSKGLSPALQHSQSEATDSADNLAVDSPPGGRARKSSPRNSKSKHLKSSKSMGMLPISSDIGRKRLSGKQEKNKTRTGGTVHSNRRVRLDDGRIGVVKYKGRTAFGKSGEDWIGIVVEYGKGQHNGSVNGRSYFRCRDGKGIMVRPDRIIEDLGNPMTKQLDDAMKKGSEEIQALLKQIARERKEERLKKKRAAEAAAAKRESSNYGGDVGWTASEYQQDDSEMFGQKLMHSKTLLDKNKDAKATRKKKMDEI